jgi:hypothetical protein
MNFTLNNHLKYYIGDRLYGDRLNPYEKFTVDIGKIDKDHYRTSNWRAEMYRIAEYVYKDFGKDVNVMFSGGTDSEIILRAFKHIGVKPLVTFIRFTNGYNQRDYEEATKIINDIGWKLNVVDFDVMEFYNSGAAKELSTITQCRQIAYLVIWQNILKLQLPSVMGGELVFQKHIAKECKWYYFLRESEDGGSIRFSLKHNIPLVVEWFTYTPEAVAFYFEHPILQNLISTSNHHKLSNVSIKNKILTDFMPEIVCSLKLHGYEKFLGFNQENYLNLYQDDLVRLEPSLDGIYIDELKRKLYD